ncbi:MAG: 5-(carboxyamino)imidazole ribonucleotide mutase [Calditrichia bacterium]|nr:5-(carboxyamino)imidazole ribonucleotide mutase [Calditrichia bacterium]
MKVAILIGSESDREVIERANPFFEYFGISFDLHVMSAHRNPTEVQEFSVNAEKNGYKIIIAGAGMAAHLGGVIAAHTTLPVIGVPLAGSHLNGVDALYSMVQMPAGVPVATMAIGSAGARNAAIFTAQILALQDNTIAEKLKHFKAKGSKL